MGMYNVRRERPQDFSQAAPFSSDCSGIRPRMQKKSFNINSLLSNTLHLSPRKNEAGLLAALRNHAKDLQFNTFR
jgi:hypothetical protein